MALLLTHRFASAAEPLLGTPSLQSTVEIHFKHLRMRSLLNKIFKSAKGVTQISILANSRPIPYYCLLSPAIQTLQDITAS
jgi:hypothetical protein